MQISYEMVLHSAGGRSMVTNRAAAGAPAKTPTDRGGTPPSTQPAQHRREPGVVAPPGLVWTLAIVAALAGAVLPTPWWQLGIAAAAVLACALSARITAPALRLGLWAALIFMLLRVAYRVVFTSTVAPPADAVLLLNLPVIELGGPLRGIALFGPLTLDALLATLADASRFAVVFIVFAAANALADARTLLAHAPRPLLPVATVLSLALGALPSLLAAAQRLAFAARLRGERRGPRLLVPVLEQAVERATALGSSMELRGFGRSHRGADDAPWSGLPGRPAGAVLLRADGITVHHGARNVLRDARIELRAGELTVITGPTGSGKSTLLAVLAGLAPAYTGGAAAGTITVGGVGQPEDLEGFERLGVSAQVSIDSKDHRPARLAGAVALVAQRVEHSFLADSVRAELAFAPVQRGIARGEVADAVEGALARFGLVSLADRDPSTLSAGEATRVAIAAAWLVEPRVMLLDEPVADLDPDSVAAVLDALRGLLADGCAVLVTEHRPEALVGVADEVPSRWLSMHEGVLATSAAAIRPVGAAVCDAAARGAEAVAEADAEADAVAMAVAVAAGADSGAGAGASLGVADARQGATGDNEPVMLAQGLVIERGGRELLRVDELAVHPGEITVLSGPNGAGKSSLLEHLALNSEAEQQRAGRGAPDHLDGHDVWGVDRLDVRGVDEHDARGVAKPTRRAARKSRLGVTLVPHRVDDLLIRDTLAAECRFADRRAGAPRGTTAARFERLIGGSILDAAALAATHPRDLSAGTRLALAIAVQLAHDPQVLLLDEPTRGLDVEARARVAALLTELAAEGRAVLLATHDAEFTEGLQHLQSMMQPQPRSARHGAAQYGAARHGAAQPATPLPAVKCVAASASAPPFTGVPVRHLRIVDGGLA